MNAPNIVLIMADQWRGDCLSIDGHPVVHTPALDELAINGTRFRRAYSANPSCIPARASLYTGLTARSHGRVGYEDGVPWDYPVTMASEFTRYGYQTQAIGKMHVYPERNQLGFQNVILHDGYLPSARSHAHSIEYIDDYIPWLRNHIGYTADDIDHGIHCNAWVARPWDKPEHLHPTNFVTTQAVEFLKRRDTRKPFFLFLSYHRPHPPYDPPAWAFEQYLHAEMSDPPVGDWVNDFGLHWQNSMGTFAHDNHPEAFMARLPEHQLRRARAGYYGHMTHIDHQIKRFIEHLKHEGLYDDTIFCFVSDHGELLGDHHLFRKSFPYEGSSRIPLIISGVDILSGQVRDELVELRDIMPSLLQAAGLPVPEHIDGKSFLQLAQGDEIVDWRKMLHGEHVIFDQTVQWLVTTNEKFIWHSGSGYMQFFDLANDPQEIHNLAPVEGYRSRLVDWQSKLASITADFEEGLSDGINLIPEQSVYPTLS